MKLKERIGQSAWLLVPLGAFVCLLAFEYRGRFGELRQRLSNAKPQATDKLNEWFKAPWWLLLLLLTALLLILAAYLVFPRDKREIQLAPIARSGPASGRRNWRSHVVQALVFITLVGLCLQIAQPVRTEQRPIQEGVLVFAVDKSGSMWARDCLLEGHMVTRMECVKEAAKASLDDIPPGIQVSLTEFSDTAVTVVPTTSDRDWFTDVVAGLEAEGGTATGDAIMAVNLTRQKLPLGKDGKPLPLTFILLSDGAQTAGVDYEVAAAKAKRDGLVVNTISFGKAGTIAVLPNGKKVDATPDPVAMQTIASTTGGEYSPADDAVKLRSIFGSAASQFGTEPVITVSLWPSWFIAGPAGILAIFMWFILNRTRRRPRVIATQSSRKPEALAA